MPQVTAELKRLGTQGAMELASALFGGGGFVPYGPGQYTPAVEGQGVDPHGVQAASMASPESGVFGSSDAAADRTAAEPPAPEQARPEPAAREQARQEMSRGR